MQPEQGCDHELSFYARQQFFNLMAGNCRFFDAGSVSIPKAHQSFTLVVIAICFWIALVLSYLGQAWQSSWTKGACPSSLIFRQVISNSYDSRSRSTDVSYRKFRMFCSPMEIAATHDAAISALEAGITFGAFPTVLTFLVISNMFSNVQHEIS